MHFLLMKTIITPNIVPNRTFSVVVTSVIRPKQNQTLFGLTPFSLLKLAINKFTKTYLE